ncbi:MAG TPA: hypothetical protein VFE10_12495 [Phenylobacterium sp.]|jgi:hypothetical protein|nr:hypothetical protein [Phenylobacterium sp.]
MALDRRTLLLTPLALGLCGFTMQPPPQQWNGGHPEALKAIWDLLAAPKVSADGKAGKMSAAFTDDLKRMNGKPIEIDGFILPLEPGREAVHFALTRRNAGCPFCPPSQPTEAAEVFLLRPVKVTGDLITISGRFVLNGSSEQGLFYLIEGATVI